MTLAGRYDLLAPPLGEGSFGAVYLANDHKMPRQVAVKVLHASYASDAKVSARFLRELVAACRVSHENVIQVLDVGDDPQHGLFYVMEYAQGVSLEERLTGQPVPWPSLHVIALQLAAALHAIHGAGIVHRDLKPRNIMLVERPAQDDLVKVLDFGIAAIHEEDSGDDVELTGTRMVVGTPPYMSPEQTYMKADRERLGLTLDGRSDLYSLGVILYEMLSGRRPFTGDAHELALAHRHDAPDSLVGRVADDVPQGVCDLVLRLLAKAPDERPPSAHQVLATLRSLQSGGPARVSPGGREQDVQDAATCIVDAVGIRAQEATTHTAPAVSLSTLATEAEDDVDYSSVRGSRTPMLAAGLALCAVLTWVAWPSSTPSGTHETPVAVPPTAADVPSEAARAPVNTARQGVPEAPVAPAHSVSLMVTSVPPRAEVLLDGVVLGKTPLTTTLDVTLEGQHLLEIDRDGYRLRQVPIAVAPHLAGKALVFNELLESVTQPTTDKPAGEAKADRAPEGTSKAKAKRRKPKAPSRRPAATKRKPKSSPKRAKPKPVVKPAPKDPFQDL